MTGWTMRESVTPLRHRLAPMRTPFALAAALVAPLLVAVVLVPFRTALTISTMALVLVVVVVAVAALGNRAAGALAALSAAAWFDFFLTTPYERFAISAADDIETAVLLLLVGLIVSQLAAHAHRLEVVTVTDAAYLARIHDTARLAQRRAAPEAVVDQVRRDLTDILGLRSCRFEYGSLLGHPARLEQDGSISIGRTRRYADQEDWPTGEIELRAMGNGHYYGRFLLTPEPGPMPPLQARLVAVTLADQAGSALDTAGRPDND
ncbi:DUF4118 domain-containing protein [Streptomyces olivaceiscleroticus]|uniref:Sensor protein KdpD transmembrane domain-containing protein n=1 Tax=Streptomyces olivaceiscleroticus TaxID=68245 RepID=A0ABN1B8B3_9ACTN